MAVREIIDYNNKLIREKSEEVLKLDDEIKDLIKDMEDTLNSSGGVGIAAVQIGVKKRIVLVKNNDKRYLVINPKIVNSFGEEEDYLFFLPERRDTCGIRGPETNDRNNSISWKNFKSGDSVPCLEKPCGSLR